MYIFFCGYSIFELGVQQNTLIMTLNYFISSFVVWFMLFNTLCWLGIGRSGPLALQGLHYAQHENRNLRKIELT